MLFDARRLSTDEILESDICIIGGGAAGIAVAREFANRDPKVILLESGGLKFEHHTQFLYKGEITGRKFTALEFTRRRQFGGSTATWFGRCRPLDGSDFERRDWIPHSGWPITFKELKPQHERASGLLDLGEFQYDNEHWDSDENNEEIEKATGLETKIFRFSPPTRFAQKYAGELERAWNIQVLLHANALHLQLEPDGNSVAHIQCSTLEKKTFRVKANWFVLALGGLETTRLMLASRNVHPEGVGNQHDLLGRFFLDHVSLFDGAALHIPEDFPDSFFKLDYSAPMHDLGMVRAIGFTENYRQKHRLLNASAFFVKRPEYKMDDSYYSEDIQDLIQVSNVLGHTAPPSLGILKSLGSTISKSRTLKSIAWKKITQARRSMRFGLQLQLECAPNPHSRVTLSDEKDALGMNRIRLDWRLTQQDLDSYHHFREGLFDGLERRGFQTRKFNHGLDSEGWPVSIVPLKHHSGTTRMHANPREGVVDETCRVHGVNNLYIASSSVFPTIGMANPTLTIIALALRLADHLKQRLRS